MPTYAHVTGTTVDAVGYPPQTAFAGGRWWDLRTLNPANLTGASWYPVQETARPADTATNTSTVSYSYSAGVVTQTWTVVAKTAEQIAADTSVSNEVTLRGQALADIANLQTSIGTLNAVIAKSNNAIAGGDTKQVAQDSRAIARATIRTLRILLQALDTTVVP